MRAVARNILHQLPVADRPGVRKIMTSKYPLRVAELLLDCWALVHGEEPPPPDKGTTP
ncbi:hypothetical protein D3C84_1178890 [compost metagenome]